MLPFTTMQILLSKLHYLILETATIVSLLLSVLVLYAYAMDPSILNPSLPTVCWSPKHILLDSIPGQDSINLCDIFNYSDGYAARVAAKTGTARLCLPVEAYPPTEEEADSIRSKIIHAAKTQADTYLVKGRVDRRQNGEVLFYLICEKGYTLYDKKRSNQEIYGNDKENSHQPAYCKEGIKNDVIVNKDATSRGIIGRRMPRRTQTNKPSLDCLCRFQLVLRLVPGKLWYLAHTTTDNGSHNHLRIAFQEKHASLRSYTPEQKHAAARFSQVAPSASAKLLTADVTGGLPPTRDQLAYNRKMIESTGLAKNLSQAEQLLEYLRDEVSKRRKRFVALFHEITHTSLLAISQYALRRRKSQMERPCTSFGGNQCT